MKTYILSINALQSKYLSVYSADSFIDWAEASDSKQLLLHIDFDVVLLVIVFPLRNKEDLPIFQVFRVFL